MSSQSFTLVELLVGLSIFSVIALSIYATFANGIDINKKSYDLETIYRDARWVFDTMSLDLENMISYQFPPSDQQIHKVLVGESISKNVSIESSNMQGGSGRYGSFVGNESSMSLLTATDAGMKIVRYSLKPFEDLKIYETIVNGHVSENKTILAEVQEIYSRVSCLVRQEMPFPDIVDQDDESEDDGSEVLSRNIIEGGMKLSYAKVDYSGDNKTVSWQSQWNEVSLPAGVRVEISFLNQSDNRPLFISKNILIPVGAWGVKEYDEENKSGTHSGSSGRN